MIDKVFNNFLETQLCEALGLAENSDILRFLPAPGALPQQFLAEFHCKGIIQNRDGEIAEGNLFVVGIFLPNDYLRRAAIPEVLTWLGPANVLHPNILGPAGAICIGHLEPGMGLVDILYQLYEIIVYRKFNPQENNSLNKAACAWARNNLSRFPTDHRPLKRPAQPAQARGGPAARAT